MSVLGPATQALAQAPTDAGQKEQPTSDDTAAEEKQKTDALIEEYSAQVGEPQTLTQLIKFARKNAPKILQAREQVGLGDAAIAGANKFQQFNPEIEGEFSLGLEDFGLAKAEITLKQRLEVAGERGLRVEAARKQKRTLQAQVAQARWDVHQRVHRLYRLGHVALARIAIEREILAFTQRLFQIAQERYAAGEEPRTSVIVAKAEIARARQRLVQSWIHYIRTLRNLGAALGWEADKPPQPSGDIDKARPIPGGAKLLDKAYRQDPQLAVLDARLDQARARLALEERKVWPNPIFGVGWEGERFLADETENKLRFIFGVPLPVWDTNQGQIAAAESRMHMIRQAIDNRKNVLKSLVLKQAESVQAAYTQAQIYQEEVLPALQTQLDLLKEGFELGELSLLDVMNARDRLLAVQRQYLDALREYFIAVSELENLLGTSIWDTQ